MISEQLEARIELDQQFHEQLKEDAVPKLFYELNCPSNTPALVTRMPKVGELGEYLAPKHAAWIIGVAPAVVNAWARGDKINHQVFISESANKTQFKLFNREYIYGFAREYWRERR